MYGSFAVRTTVTFDSSQQMRVKVVSYERKIVTPVSLLVAAFFGSR